MSGSARTDRPLARSVSAYATLALAMLIAGGIEVAISWLVDTPFDRINATVYLVGILYVDARSRAQEVRDDL